MVLVKESKVLMLYCKYHIFLNRSRDFYYSNLLPLLCGFSSRAASLQWRLLFNGGFSSMAASLQGRLLITFFVDLRAVGFYLGVASI